MTTPQLAKMVHSIADIPTYDHYAIFTSVVLGNSIEERMVRYEVFTDRESWEMEVKRLLLAGTPMIPIEMRPALIEVKISARGTRP